jgi:redox-regulated HSP33 family molecular chaperone
MIIQKKNPTDHCGKEFTNTPMHTACRTTGIRHMLRAMGLVLLLALVIITQTGCSSDKTGPVTGEDYLLDTICSIRIYEMIADGEAIEVNCHFCNSHYKYDIDDLKKLLNEAK